MIIRLNICVSDIEKDRIRTSDKNGKKYLNLTVMDSRQPSQYGDDGTISHDTTKEERDEDPKVRGKIIGNWKWVVRPDEGQAAPVRPKATFKKPERAETAEDQDAIPF